MKTRSMIWRMTLFDMKSIAKMFRVKSTDKKDAHAKARLNGRAGAKPPSKFFASRRLWRTFLLRSNLHLLPPTLLE